MAIRRDDQSWLSLLLPCNLDRNWRCHDAAKVVRIHADIFLRWTWTAWGLPGHRARRTSSAVENPNDAYPYEPKFDEIPTLQDIVDLAESARPDAVIEHVVDDAGVPQSLILDPVPNGTDDEECYEVTDLLTVA